MPQWLVPQLQELLKALGQRLPTIGAALAVLVIGWIVALILRKATFAGLRRTRVDDKIAEAIGVETGGDHGDRIERIIASIVYYIAIAVMFVVFFNVLGIEAITHPLVTMLNGFAGAVPFVIKAALIGLAGIIGAMLVRSVIVKVLQKLKFDERVGTLLPELEKPAAEEAPKAKKGKKEAPAKASLSQTIGNVAYWFILAITAVPVIEALQIGVLAKPLASALETVTTYFPRVLGAAVILILGYVLARVLRAATSGILSRIGLDRALSKLGLGKALEGHSVSGLLGTVVFALVLVQSTVSALGRLQIDEISRPATLALEQVYGYAPKLFVGALLLAVGVVLARVVGNLAASIMAALGFNTLLGHIGLVKQVSEQAAAQETEAKKAVDGAVKSLDEGGKASESEVDAMFAGRQRLRTPADIVGLVVNVIVVLLFLRQALSSMQLGTLAGMLDSFIGFLPHIFVACAVLLAGLWAGRFAETRVDELTANSADALMRALGRITRVALVVFASFMALQQLGVGRELLALAFGLLLGAVCLALALAFGLGGREVASRILAKEYDKRQKR